MRTTRPLEPLLTAIRAAHRIALVCHVNPDGDTLGSALALGMGLKALGYEVAWFCQDEVPEQLRFLPGVEAVRKPEDAEGDYDLLICVDTSDVDRLGDCKQLLTRVACTAQIDHHGTNTRYCQVNCVDGTASACALMAYEAIERLGCALTREQATCLAVGLSTDTTHLSYPSTTPEAYHVMGELMEAGARISEIYRRVYRERPPRQVALLGRALNRISYHCDGRITAIRLTRQDFLDCGASGEDSDIIPNYGMAIRGVRMSVFARENDQGSVTMSLRSVEPYRVSGVAQRFGGGGHRYAAGATVQMPLDELLPQVLSAMKEELEMHA